MAQVTDPVFIASDLPPALPGSREADVVIRGLSAGYPTSSASYPALFRATSYPNARLASVRVAFSIRS